MVEAFSQNRWNNSRGKCFTHDHIWKNAARWGSIVIIRVMHHQLCHVPPVTSLTCPLVFFLLVNKIKDLLKLKNWVGPYNEGPPCCSAERFTCHTWACSQEAGPVSDFRFFFAWAWCMDISVVNSPFSSSSTRLFIGVCTQPRYEESWCRGGTRLPRPVAFGPLEASPWNALCWPDALLRAPLCSPENVAARHDYLLRLT